jgi:hypothetical protein
LLKILIDDCTSLNSLLASGLGGNGRRSTRGGRLVDKRLVNVGDNTSAGDGSLDEGIKLLVTTNGKKKVARSDTLDLQILAGIASKLKNLSSEVLHDSGGVNRRGSANALLRVNACLQETVNTADRELKTCSGRARLGGALRRRGFATLAALATLTAFSAFASASEIHFDSNRLILKCAGAAKFQKYLFRGSFQRWLLARLGSLGLGEFSVFDEYLQG